MAKKKVDRKGPLGMGVADITPLRPEKKSVVVEYLEVLLERAKQGLYSGVGFVAILADGGHYAGHAIDNCCDIHLLGACRLLEGALLDPDGHATKGIRPL